MRIWHFVAGWLDTPVGVVPQVATHLRWQDHGGAILMRWGIGRFRYAIAPGLYAVGNPNPESEVLVTANYKLSFDHLRRHLAGRDLWILVLDTKGINVWCAAGKGTFGTDELVRRIRASRLEELVSHRRLILPQLGAPGVAAHKVKEQTGFRVSYGP
ncbi:MAG: acetyl-CoA synthase subunit gamma, partial [Deltaproteobacteria bacterium]